MVNPPLISVVIPAYNQAEFLREAIQSVIDQTYTNFEVIVIDDASPDHTSEVVMQFDDPRINLVAHEENRGLPAARNTGMRASSGEFIALLDADDFFHPEKLGFHLHFLTEHRQIDVSYNNRFELNYSSKTIREIVRPPSAVSLSELVQSFPFSPSEMVIRRECLDEAGLFDESYIHGGEDLEFNCRLALAGCQFARVDRALNYRRHHSGRGRKNLPGRLNDVKRALNSTFSDSRCPDEVRTLQSKAVKHHLMVLSSLAFIQEETELAQQYFEELIYIDATLIEGVPCELVRFLLDNILADESEDHEVLLEKVSSQIPSKLERITEQVDWAVQQGYLIKGIRAIIWDRTEIGREYFTKAEELGAKLDDRYLQKLIYQLISYRIEFGDEAAQEVIRNLTPFLKKVGNGDIVRRLKGQYFANNAMNKYVCGNYPNVPNDVIRAVVNSPSYAFNRGMISIFIKSLVNSPA